jgi:hypothetical protein
MRVIFGILFTLLLILLGSVVQPAPNTAQAQAQLCKDGQSMDSRPSCICRPPLKFLPGNICGSGQKQGVSPTAPTNPPGGVVRAICEVNMVPAATGCRCEAPMKVLPGGRCGLPTAAGAPCREGESIKATRCKCNPPLMPSANFLCIRCLPGDGDKVVNGRCVIAKRR